MFGFMKKDKSDKKAKKLKKEKKNTQMTEDEMKSYDKAMKQFYSKQSEQSISPPDASSNRHTSGGGSGDRPQPPRKPRLSMATPYSPPPSSTTPSHDAPPTSRRPPMKPGRDSAYSTSSSGGGGGGPRLSYNNHQQGPPKPAKHSSRISTASSSDLNGTCMSISSPEAAPSPPEDDVDFTSEWSHKKFDNLPLPEVVTVKNTSSSIRKVEIKKNSDGFGFALAISHLSSLDGGPRDGIFLEPSQRIDHAANDLRPGDIVLSVNGQQLAANATRDHVVAMVKSNPDKVVFTLKTVSELKEISSRSIPTSHESSPDTTENGPFSADQVWIVHADGYSSGTLMQSLPSSSGRSEQLKVKVTATGEILTVDDGDIEKSNPPTLDAVEDLGDLLYVNECSVLHVLRSRLHKRLIHTHCGGGDTLIVINPATPMQQLYTTNVMKLFRGVSPCEMPPHVYGLAERAYNSMKATRKDHAVLAIGRSGSGKTTSTRNIVKYLVEMTASVACRQNVLNDERLNAVYTILDAFGNCRTIMNTTATRCSYFTSLHFDSAGQLQNASLQLVNIEKSRIVKRPDGEPTFDVFYHLLAGANSQLKKELHLEKLSEPSVFMTPLQRTEEEEQADKALAVQSLARLQYSMGVLGFKPHQITAILCLISSIYHLGVASCTKGQNNKFQFQRPSAAAKAANVLGCSVDALNRAIFQAASKPDTRPNSPAHESSVSGMEALEGFVVGLYAEVFNAVIALLNKSLMNNARTTNSILVLEQPGFQNAATCGRNIASSGGGGGASYEDFKHNYMSERLQSFYHERKITACKDLYSQENISYEAEDDNFNPDSICELIDKPSLQPMIRSTSCNDSSDNKGLLWILNEEALTTGASDKTFTDRTLQMYGAKSTISDEDNKRQHLVRRGRNQVHAFTIGHHNSTNRVQYDTRGWIKTSRETTMAKHVTGLLQNTSRDEIDELLSTTSKSLNASLDVSSSSTGTLRRTASMRRPTANSALLNGVASVHKKYAAVQVKVKVDNVIDVLRRCSGVFFVHCFLPYNNAGLCDLNQNINPSTPLDVTILRDQITGSAIVNAVRLHRQGYPESMSFEHFRQRFELLTFDHDSSANTSSNDNKDASTVVLEILEKLEVPETKYKIGLSLVFFRSGSLSQLDAARDEKITGILVSIQARGRGYLARKRLHKVKIQAVATKCIQRNIRKLTAIQEWPWWRLFVKVKPLLDVHRTEAELKEKEEELEDIRSRLEKSDVERLEYKQMVDDLHAKLLESTSELAEERNLSTHTAEMMELETVSRMNAEKQLIDFKVEFDSMQKDFAKSELELMQTNILLSSLDQELANEDQDDDIDMYREKYERARRETELLKHRNKIEIDKQIEDFETFKKQSNKKLASSYDTIEDQESQVHNWKRKAQRLQADLQDLQLHVETADGRNAELEKKQRKFDGELRKVNESLRVEKTERDSMIRAKDEITAEKNTLEEINKDQLIDLDVQKDKISRLEQEIEDLSSHDITDNKEVVSLKRQKAELTEKCNDQEEELDDQAGTIQQLEQYKLKADMLSEKQRQKFAKELDEKEEEIEELRNSMQKKVKSLEIQMEEAFQERQQAFKEKREFERMAQAMSDCPKGDKNLERRLKKDLKKTRSLLRDAQSMLDRQKETTAGKNNIKNLKNQLEDAEFATAAAVKSKRSLENELSDALSQLDDMSRLKNDTEDRYSAVNREKAELQNTFEDIEEDLEETMKKYKTSIDQNAINNITIRDQVNQINEYESQKQSFQEEISQLESELEKLKMNSIDKQTLTTIENRLRDSEVKLDFEKSSRHRSETQLNRVKEQMERLQDDKVRLENQDHQRQEELRKLQRSLRTANEEILDFQAKEYEINLKKQETESELEEMRNDFTKSQGDLRLAFKRIHDLQQVIEEDMMSSSDGDNDSFSSEDGGRHLRFSSDEDEELSTILSSDSEEEPPTPTVASSRRRRASRRNTATRGTVNSEDVAAAMAASDAYDPEDDLSLTSASATDSRLALYGGSSTSEPSEYTDCSSGGAGGEEGKGDKLARVPSGRRRGADERAEDYSEATFDPDYDDTEDEDDSDDSDTTMFGCSVSQRGGCKPSRRRQRLSRVIVYADGQYL